MLMVTRLQKGTDMARTTKNALVGNDVFTIEHFLFDEECRELISSSESIGFEAATVNAVGGQQYMPDWRNNTRVIVDDLQRAAWLWDRAAPVVPESIGEWRAVGVNERLRFYRYDPGQQFNWHTDGYFLRENGEKSFLTFMIYLNGGFGGGETSFTDEMADQTFEAFAVTPEPGLALFFTHHLCHKGEPVSEGRKYVLRTDVMYRR